MRSLFGFLLIAFCAMAAVARADEVPANYSVVLLTENYPPYNFAADGKNYADDANVQGIGAEVVREMFKRAGIRYNLTLRFPWDRIYKLAQEKSGYGLFVTARTSEREALFKWVGPIGPDDWVMLARADSRISLERLDQARRYKIGAYKSDAVAQSLSHQGFDPVISLRDQDNAKKLQAGEIDLWATGDPAGYYLARQSGITQMKTVLRFNSTDLYLALNRDVPDEVVQRLQKALEQMRADGFIDAVMARYL